MNFIPERTPKSAAGLAQMCEYILREMIVSEKKFSAGVTYVLVEVGVWTGRGTMVFEKHFGKVIAVDPWAPGPEIAAEYDMSQVERIFDKRFAGNPRVVKMKLPSLRAAEQFGDETLDAVYIDAIHEYKAVKADLLAWAPKVRKGGFLCGHDYEKRFPGVKDAVNEFIIIGMLSGLKTFPDASWAVKL